MAVTPGTGPEGMPPSTGAGVVICTGGKVGAGVGGDAGQLGFPAAPPLAGAGVMAMAVPLRRHDEDSVNPGTQVPSHTPVPVLVKQEDSIPDSL